MEFDNTINLSFLVSVKAQDVVKKLESKTPLTSDAWRAIANTEWQKNQTPAVLVKIVKHLSAEDLSHSDATRYLKVLLKSGLLSGYLRIVPDAVTALFGAVLDSKDLELLDLLANANIDINTVDSKGIFPLFLACKTGNPEIVNHMLHLQPQPRVNLQGKKGYSALMMACWGGSVEIARLLIQHGACLDLQDNSGKTAIFYASGMEILPQLGLTTEDIGPLMMPDQDGVTPLHIAVIKEDVETVRFLLSKGVDRNPVDQLGSTPLINACELGEEEMINLLLDCKVNAQVVNVNGDTPYSVVQIKFPKGNPVIMRLKKLDDGLTAEVRDRRYLAHLYGIGESDDKNVLSVIEVGQGHFSKFDLEGMHATDALNLFRENLDAFYSPILSAANIQESLLEHARRYLDPHTMKDELDALARLNPQKASTALAEAVMTLQETRWWNSECVEDPIESITNMISRLDEDKMLSFLLNWKDHAVAALLTPDKLYRCNRGAKNKGRAGIILDRIKKTDAFPVVLRALLDLTPEYFNTGIQYDLGLVPEEYLAQQPQKVGNCPVANSNSLELAVLWCTFEKQIGRDEAELVARAIQKVHTTQSRLMYSKRYLAVHESKDSEKFAPDLTLIKNSYSKRQREIVPREWELRRQAIRTWAIQRLNTADTNERTELLKIINNK